MSLPLLVLVGVSLQQALAFKIATQESLFPQTPEVLPRQDIPQEQPILSTHSSDSEESEESEEQADLVQPKEHRNNLPISFLSQQQPSHASSMPQDSLVPSNSRSIDFDGGYPIPGVDLYPQTIRPGVFRSGISEPLEPSESSESTKDEKLDNYNPFTPNQPYNDGLKIPTVLNLLEEQAKQYFELYGNSATTAQGFCNTYRNTLVYSDYLTNYCVYIDSYVQNSD